MYQITIFVLILIVTQSIEASRSVGTRTITEKQGRDVVLSCQFEQLRDGDRVMWSKDDIVLSVKAELSGNAKKYEIIGKYDLIIKSVVEQDSGRYLCQNFDMGLSMNVLLTVLTRPTQPDIQQTNQTLVENQVGKFLCMTQGGNPLPTFNWLINQMKINESLYNNYSNPRQSYSELYLPLEKRFHHGVLSCQVQNQALDRPLITSLTLNILYKPNVSLHYDQNVISNLNTLVIENDRLTIDCKTDSNPPSMASITWLKDGVSIPGVSSPSLILSTIRRADDGEYSCLTMNAIGRGQSTTHIRVQYPPMVQLNGGGLLTENEKLVLKCDVHSYPPIDYYQWYKNNERLNTSSLTSSITIDKVSKEDAGIYRCMVKNTLKYSNGSSVERFNKTQTTVSVQYAPKMHTIDPIIAVDLSATDIKLPCTIDSYPESTIIWKLLDKVIFNSNKYSIRQNKSFSCLTIRQIQSNTDYGLYSCSASNKLGYNSTTIQLRSKDVPESPTDLNITNVGYSTIDLQWKPGFDGGWPQAFWISLDYSVWKETNQSYFKFTNLHHLQYYNVSVRAFNQLGQSSDNTFLRVQTKDVPLQRDDLSIIEQSFLHLPEKTLNYRLNNSSFTLVKAPLCIRVGMFNRTDVCQRIVTSSGMLKFEDTEMNEILNVSVCLDQYEDFCGETIPVEIQRDTSFNWMFILISAILTVGSCILLGLSIFCFVCKGRGERPSTTHNLATMSNKKASQQPVLTSPVPSTPNSPIKFFSNITYPEQQQIPSSYSKLAEIQKLDQFHVTSKNTRQLSIGSSDPILSNPNSSSLSGSDQLTVTDMHPTDALSTTNEYITPQYIGYGFPVFGTKTKEDSAESGYSTPLRNPQLNKKTVYEVVV